MEAYPDVANNYVQVITQWPGRAAEEVEQQVSIPIEAQMNGLPQLTALRSVSLFGLSSVMMVFDDGSSNDLNRQKVLEKLSQVNLPNGLQPTIGPDLQPGRADLFLHAAEHQSLLRRDESEVAAGLGADQTVEVRAGRDRCGGVRRHHARIPGERRSQQSDRLRTEHRAGGTGAGQQQHQCGRQLHRARRAGDQCARGGVGRKLA